MSLLNLQASYFAFENPLRQLERRFNRFCHRARVRVNRREVELRWTERAESELRRDGGRLVVELQLYFSCVVKKRVLFHRERVAFDTIRVDQRLELAFRPIASAVCEPGEFVARYPEGRDLASGLAARMVPRAVEIDFRRGRWEGQFLY